MRELACSDRSNDRSPARQRGRGGDRAGEIGSSWVDRAGEGEGEGGGGGERERRSRKEREKRRETRGRERERFRHIFFPVFLFSKTISACFLRDIFFLIIVIVDNALHRASDAMRADDGYVEADPETKIEEA